LRAGVGVGLVVTYSNAIVYDSADANQAQYEHPQGLGVYPMADAAAAIGHMFGDRWSFETGPLMTVLRQQFSIKMPLPGGPDHVPARGVEWSWLVGLRRTL
jgi:hypothetical protein